MSFIAVTSLPGTNATQASISVQKTVKIRVTATFYCVIVLKGAFGAATPNFQLRDGWNNFGNNFCRFPPSRHKPSWVQKALRRNSRTSHFSFRNWNGFKKQCEMESWFVCLSFNRKRLPLNRNEMTAKVSASDAGKILHKRASSAEP